MFRSRQSACLDQLWRALLNASRRIRSRLRRCDTSSLNAPALPLLPVAPNLRRLSRKLNQRQPPLSPDLLRVGKIEGAHTRHDATPSQIAKDPGPRGSGIPEEWILHPLMVQRIWEIFDRVRVDLFASKDNSHCPIFFTRSTDALAHEWSSLPFYAFPPVALLPQALRRVREQRHKLILISPLWRDQLWASGVIPAAEISPVTDPLETGPPLSSERHELWALHVWPLNGSLSSS